MVQEIPIQYQSLPFMVIFNRQCIAHSHSCMYTYILRFPLCVRVVKFYLMCHTFFLLLYTYSHPTTSHICSQRFTFFTMQSCQNCLTFELFVRWTPYERKLKQMQSVVMQLKFNDWFSLYHKCRAVVIIYMFIQA